jgi:transposase
MYTAQHLSTTEISQLVCVSRRTVRRYIKKFKLTGEVQPTHHCHGPKRLLGEYEQLFLLQTILRNPGIYLHEIKAKVKAKFGVAVGSSTICKALKHMGCSRQVIQHIAIQRNEQLRAKFMAEISKYDPSMLIWLDESGCDRRHSARKWGYSLRGMPPRDHRLLVRGTRYSAVPVSSLCL